MAGRTGKRVGAAPAAPDRQGPPTDPDDIHQPPPDVRALALINELNPFIYTDTRDRAIIALPPGYEPIPVNSAEFRGIIAELYNATHPHMMLIRLEEAKRVQMALTGRARKTPSPVMVGEFDPLWDHDPLLLAVYYYMVKQHDNNRDSYRATTTTLMGDVAKAAPHYGIPIRLIPDDARVFGKGLRALIPQFLQLGVKVELRHTRRGTEITLTWVDPPDEDGDDNGRSSPPSSHDNPNQGQPLRRSDGTDADEVFAKLDALDSKEEPDP